MENNKIEKIDEQIEQLKGKIEQLENEVDVLKDNKSFNPIKLLSNKKKIKEKNNLISELNTKIGLNLDKKKKEIQRVEKAAESKLKREQRTRKIKEFCTKYKKPLIIISPIVLLCLVGAYVFSYYSSTLHSIEFCSPEDTIYIGDSLNIEYEIDPKNVELKDNIDVRFNEQSYVRKNDDSFMAASDGDLVVSIYYGDKLYDQKTIHILPIALENYIVKDLDVVLNHSADCDIESYPKNATYTDYVLNTNDKDIIKIEDNTIYGIGEGEALVTVSSKDGKVENNFKVKVIDVIPNSIEFVDDSSNYVIDKEYKIEFKYTPDVLSNTDFEIVSSNEGILKVNKNVVKAVGVGSAILTIKHPSGISCSKDITVKYPPIEKVSITGYPEDSIYVGQTYQLKCEYEPEKADEVQFEWKSSDEKIAKVNNSGVITAIASGSATIYLTSKNGMIDHVSIKVIEKQTSSSDTKDGSNKGTTNTQKETEAVSGDQDLVWIPTNGGKKYHSHAGCSNMSNPIQVTRSEAQAQGYTACKRCY